MQIAGQLDQAWAVFRLDCRFDGNDELGIKAAFLVADGQVFRLGRSRVFKHVDLCHRSLLVSIRAIGAPVPSKARPSQE